MSDIISVPLHIESDDPWHRLFSEPMYHELFQTSYPCIVLKPYPPETPFRQRWFDNNQGDIRYRFWSDYLDGQEARPGGGHVGPKVGEGEGWADSFLEGQL